MSKERMKRMYILKKCAGDVTARIGYFDTVDRLVDAVAHHVDLHGPTEFFVEETSEMDDVCRQAVETFDDLENSIVAFEELGELQKEVCKKMRGMDNDEHMAEEIVDSLIAIRKLIIRYGLHRKVEEWTRRKLDALRKKLEWRV